MCRQTRCLKCAPIVAGMLCRGYSPVQEVPHGRPHHKFVQELSAERLGTDLLYTQWDSDPQFSSGPDSFFAGWEDEDEG